MINGNTAKTSSEFYDYGGGIYNSAHLSIYNTSIIGNVADYGGGINNGGTVVLTQVTISGNSATIGGGLFNDDGNATLAHVTFSDNSAQIGGGISHFVGSKTITLKNVLLDRSASGGNCNLFKPIISAGFNLSSDGSCTSFTQAGDRQNVDPLLGPLADNGGPTLTHMLLPGSPAIDTGQCVKGLETDQRGLPRFQGPACDIGAVEVQPGGGPDESAVYQPAIIK